MTIRPRVLRAAALAACLVPLAACGGADTAAPPAAPPAAGSSTGHEAHSAQPGVTATGSLDAADQNGDGTSVTVAAVSIDAGGMGGWITLHEDAAGKPGPVTYFVAVPAGASSDVVIPTAGGIRTGSYWPMLHVDDHTAGTYEFPQVQGADLPVVVDGAVVMEKIVVTVG
jgi:hypothetical protein